MIFASVPSGGMRILIIEDDASMGRFLKRTLENAHFAVDLFTDGSEGSFHARVNDYDLIILDDHLPGKHGLDICRDIRNHGKNVPVLMLVEAPEASARASFLNEGADDCLSKPIAVEELLARIRALMRRPTEVLGDVFEIDDIVLDLRKGTVTRAGERVYLTRKEFMLLEYLMRNQGVTLSRGMLIEHVWDMSVDVFSNTVESHILALRKKMDDRSGVRFIETVPGRGYRIP